jgi:2',3'-cyclic-nucleotide 2'-phosphodiesterase (5'-nucleotidase family)
MLLLYCTCLLTSRYNNVLAALVTDITFGDLITVQPFSNTVDTIELKGEHLLEVLEFSVSRPYSRHRGKGHHKRDLEEREFRGQGFLQMSGKSPNVYSTLKQKA